MKCPDCGAHIYGGGHDLVMTGTPGSHSMIYGRTDDGRYASRKCPTMLARDFQIKVEVFGGERAQRWGFLRHPEPSPFHWGHRVIGAFIPPWPGEKLPIVQPTRSFT